MKAILIIMIALIAIGPIAYAGDLEPIAAPAPTMKTLDEIEPRTPIPGSDTPSSTFIISLSGSYYLTGNRNASGSGISVVADHVTIDLNGYSLIGPGTGSTDGIYMTGRKSVKIHNGTVRNFGRYAIADSSTAGKNHRLINVRVIGNGLSGYYTAVRFYSQNSLVKNCTVADNTGYGIYTDLGGTISGNTCSNNGFAGIYTAKGCTISGNTTSHNSNYGIATAPGNTVINNTSSYNGAMGISAAASTVTGNTASYNQQWGLYLTGENLIDVNSANFNNQSGGAYGNMYAPAGNTIGINHTP